jgi:hypothetical protein
MMKDKILRIFKGVSKLLCFFPFNLVRFFCFLFNLSLLRRGFGYAGGPSRNKARQKERRVNPPKGAARQRTVKRVNPPKSAADMQVCGQAIIQPAIIQTFPAC